MSYPIICKWTSVLVREPQEKHRNLWTFQGIDQFLGLVVGLQSQSLDMKTNFIAK